MDIGDVLERFKKDKLSLSEAKRQLKMLMVKNIEDFARLDVNRHLRRAFPELVYAKDKEPRATAKIAAELVKLTGRAIVTRTTPNHVNELKKLSSEFKVEVHARANIFIVRKRGEHPPKKGGKVGVISAGTADITVAEEAVVILREMGCKVKTAYDIGVAGLHRIFPPLRMMLDAGVDVLVVVAGMEGALPSVVASLVDCPVVGVPTSIGYGYGGGGEAALMSMLQSCSLGLAVVNIDNGVGAGVLAALIANRVAKARESKE